MRHPALHLAPVGHPDGSLRNPQLVKRQGLEDAVRHGGKPFVACIDHREERALVWVTFVEERILEFDPKHRCVVSKGAQSGCPLSPLLTSGFNGMLEWISTSLGSISRLLSFEASTFSDSALATSLASLLALNSTLK